MHSEGTAEKARDGQTPNHGREGQEKRGHSDTKGSSGIQAAAPGALCHCTFPFPVYIAIGYPRKAQLAQGKDSLPWEGCLLQFLPLQKTFKW